MANNIFTCHANPHLACQSTLHACLTNKMFGSHVCIMFHFVAWSSNHKNIHSGVLCYYTLGLCTVTQALDKQDEQIEELERTAAEMQQELADANKSVEQHASSMQKVISPQWKSVVFMHCPTVAQRPTCFLHAEGIMS